LDFEELFKQLRFGSVTEAEIIDFTFKIWKSKIFK